jgi:hypothetical protein
MGKIVHVICNLGKWNIIISGLSKASRVYDTKEEAMDYAKVRAKEMKSDIYIHGNDGAVQEVIKNEFYDR